METMTFPTAAVSSAGVHVCFIEPVFPPEPLLIWPPELHTMDESSNYNMRLVTHNVIQLHYTEAAENILSLAPACPM